MKKLEARFHPPFAGTAACIVVGHVIVGGQSEAAHRIEPSASLAQHGAPAPILATLRYLVAATARGSVERLESLRIPYWSFVPIAVETPEVQEE
jgi:hypothetical protein